jgi:hypothetical protein
MACRADDEGLAPHFRHEGGPRGLAWPGSAGFVERGNLVGGDRGSVLAQLAPPLAGPGDQLLAGVADPGRGGVVDDRAPVLPEGDPAESCYRVLLAFPLQPGLEAGPGAVADRVYAVWTQAPLHSSNTNIMFQYSRDNGNTWTKPVRLNDDHTANSQFFPAIAVDQATGDMAASWYD